MWPQIATTLKSLNILLPWKFMADVHGKKTRIYNISVIRSKGTKPELIVRKFLFKNGFRYKLHDKMLQGIVMKAVNILHKKREEISYLDAYNKAKEEV